MVISEQQAIGETAANWTCDSCDVVVSWADRQERGLPPGWTGIEHGVVCLNCQRSLVGEAAGKQPFRTSIQERLRLRSEGVIDFEVSRVPSRSNRDIAQALHTSLGAVQKGRERAKLIKK